MGLEGEAKKGNRCHRGSFIWAWGKKKRELDRRFEFCPFVRVPFWGLPAS